MNYQKIYDQIISRAQNRVLEIGVYFEKHHKIPRCMGGDDSPENLVKLTAREHFICHWLLIRIYPKHEGLIYAFSAMCNLKNNIQQRYTPPSRIFEEIKVRVNELRKNRVVSQETRDKMSHSAQNKPEDTEETKEKKRIANKNKGPFSEEHKEKLGQSKRENTTLKAKTCPFCLKTCDPANALQHHFDYCKLNPNRKTKRRVFTKNYIDNFKQITKNYREENSKTCIFCLKLIIPLHFRYHFDSCKENPKNLGKRPSEGNCNFCLKPYFTSTKQYHLDKCKLNPDRV